MLCCDILGWWRQKMEMTSSELENYEFAPPRFWSKESQTGSKSKPLSLFSLGSLVLIWMASNMRRGNSLDSLSSTFTSVQSISWPPLRTTCSLTADLELIKLYRFYFNVTYNDKKIHWGWDKHYFVTKTTTTTTTKSAYKIRIVPKIQVHAGLPYELIKLINNSSNSNKFI